MGIGTGGQGGQGPKWGQERTQAGKKMNCPSGAFGKRCFFQSCYQSVFSRGSRRLTAAAVEVAGARGVALSPSRHKGWCLLPALESVNLSSSIPPPPQNPEERATGWRSERDRHPREIHTACLSVSSPAHTHKLWQISPRLPKPGHYATALWSSQSWSYFWDEQATP